MKNHYDIIVVGGGHAGCEAAASAASMGSKVLLISMDIAKLAQMSCNPAMGGIGKGQILREIDALGGFSGIITDKSTIQFRMLNRSKGPAMWSPRAQCDRMVFSSKWREQIELIPNLQLCQDIVVSLIISKNIVLGVKTKLGIHYFSKSVILTNGTFLNGLIHIGDINFSGGRIGELSSFGLSEQLVRIGFEIGRMKTGTPVRIDERSVELDKLIEQKGDNEERFFSYITKTKNNLKQKNCYLAYTNSKVHEILKTGFNESPLFKGVIKGVGPRYCPSIEDKLRTFSDKESHQLFLEPEGENTYEMYLNGFSSSLPPSIQKEALMRVDGFKDVHIIRPGYAIEYDYFPPTQLNYSLETKIVENLFFAGQINGTTGYEEAAAQGLIAGINAHRKNGKLEEFVLKRNESYIGVLIDDLVTKGVDEPYRMFTSRAEHRIVLRQDNADERLTPLGQKIGLVTDERFKLFNKKYSTLKTIHQFVVKTSVKPEEINPFLETKGTNPINQSKKIHEILLRPEVSLLEIFHFFSNTFYIEQLKDISIDEILESIDIRIKYGGYIQREEQVVQKINKFDHIQLKNNINYLQFLSISTEARQKLEKIKPKTVGQARRIPGVSPNDINVLLVFLGK